MEAVMRNVALGYRFVRTMLSSVEVALCCSALDRWQMNVGPATTTRSLQFFTCEATCDAMRAAIPHLTEMGQRLAAGIIHKIETRPEVYDREDTRTRR
jgi:hypothetical protein